MKYQIVKHNKTSARTVKLYDTLAEARAWLATEGAQFTGISYIGGFPGFHVPGTRKQYTIQGGVEMGEGRMVVCSINKKELEEAGFVG